MSSVWSRIKELHIEKKKSFKILLLIELCLIAACIIGMCTVGSIAAYFTHQTVLGGFSLFLCVAIGIRFLVSPDSKERPEKDGNVKLTIKEI